MWCAARQTPRVHVVRPKVLMILSKMKRQSSAPTVAPCVLRVPVTGQGVLSYWAGNGCENVEGTNSESAFCKLRKTGKGGVSWGWGWGAVGACDLWPLEG